MYYTTSSVVVDSHYGLHRLAPSSNLWDASSKRKKNVGTAPSVIPMAIRNPGEIGTHVIRGADINNIKNACV